MGEVKCPRCGRDNEADALNCRECGLQLREAPSVMQASLETGAGAETVTGFAPAPKKSRVGLIVGVIVGVAVVAAAATAAVLLLGGNKTLGVTADEIEGWFRDAAEEDRNTAPLLVSLWELDEDIDVDYVETSDKKLENFRFNSFGLDVVGICDAKSHEMMEVFVVGGMSTGFSLYEDEYSSSLIESATIASEIDHFALILEHIFELSEEEALEMAEGSKNGETCEKNGVTYYIKGYSYDDDMAFIISTFDDDDDLLDYINELTED